MTGPRSRRKALWRAVLDVVLPRSCLGCGRGVASQDFRYLCPSCRADLEFIEDPRCPRCGAAYVGEVLTPTVCANCREVDPAFAGGRSLLRHRGLGGEIVRAVKYGRARYLLPDIELLWGRDHHLAAWAGPTATFVPVPLHPVRLRERGFNQSLLLARAAGRWVPGAAVDELLRRTRPTRQQTRLRAEERHANVRNAFALRGGVEVDLARHYVVVDDVLTTGATLDACARVLLRAGAARVSVLTLAHG